MQDLYVFSSEHHAAIDFPPALRTPEVIVTTADRLASEPGAIVGATLRDVFFYCRVDPTSEAVVRARINRGSEPSRWFGPLDEKPALPRLPA